MGPQYGSFINFIFERSSYFQIGKKCFKIMSILWLNKGSITFLFILYSSRKKELFHALSHSEAFSIHEKVVQENWYLNLTFGSSKCCTWKTIWKKRLCLLSLFLSWDFLEHLNICLWICLWSLSLESVIPIFSLSQTLQSQNLQYRQNFCLSVSMCRRAK